MLIFGYLRWRGFFFHYIKIMYNVCDFKMKLTFIAHLEKKGVIANKITH